MSSQVATDSRHSTSRLDLNSEIATSQHANGINSSGDEEEEGDAVSSLRERYHPSSQLQNRDQHSIQQQQHEENSENSANSWTFRRSTGGDSQNRLRVVLPTDQKSLVTPNIITTGDSVVTTPTQLFNSLVSFNGQEVGLFTGLPSCTPTSADALAATGALHNVNPFFLGVTSFGNQQQQDQHQHQHQHQQSLQASKNNPNKISTESNRCITDSEENLEKRSAKLSKLSLDQLHTPSNDVHQFILSPLSLLLSPEQEAWIRYGLHQSNQHPLAGQQAPSQMPEMDFSNFASVGPHQLAYGPKSVEEATLAYHHHQQQQQQQQQHVYAQDLTNQLLARQRQVANANLLDSMHQVVANKQPAPSNLSGRSIPTNTSSQEANSNQPIHAQAAGREMATELPANRMVDDEKEISIQAPVATHSQATYSMNHQTQTKNPAQNNSLAQNGSRNQQQPTRSSTQVPTTIVHNRSENGSVQSSVANRNTTLTSTISHRGQLQMLQSNSVHPPPVAHHHNQQQQQQQQAQPQLHYQNQSDAYLSMNGTATQPNHKLVIDHFHQQSNQNQSAINRPSQPIHRLATYENGHSMGFCNQQLRQYYLVQQQQANYHPVRQPLHNQNSLYIQKQQQSFYPSPNQQPVNSDEETERNRRDSRLESSSSSFSGNDNNSHIKESFSNSSSLMGGCNTSPKRLEVSTNPSSERSSISRDTINVDVTVTAVSSPSNPTQTNQKKITQTSEQTKTEPMKISHIKRIVIAESKTPILKDPNSTIVVKKSKGGRKKKLVTHEELIARKNRSKERNRVAAKRCRQKRKQFLDELNEKIDNLNDMNKKLQRENTMLKDELDSLKKHHKSCKVRD